MLEFIASIFFAMAKYNIITLFAGYVVSGILFYFASKSKTSAKKTYIRILAILIFIYSTFNVFFGYTIAGNLINGIGEKGTAVTVSIRQTNSQYNDYWIMEYTIIIETKEKEKIETTFEDADFNLYPEPAQGYAYPVVGEKFSVKYLSSNPKAFVIITDDDSPYSKRIKCDYLKTKFNEAYRKFKFDSTNSKYREQYIKTQNELDENGCF
jgi:hypothetical protein